MDDIKTKELKTQLKLVENECLLMLKQGTFYEAIELIVHVSVNMYEKSMVDRLLKKLDNDFDPNPGSNVVEFKPKE